MMESVMYKIFGAYEPIILISDTGASFACVDVAYIANVAIFGLCLLSLFRLIGTLFKR